MIITITGPRSVGKSTIAPIVAKKLKLKYVSSDELANKALKKEGGLSKAIKSGKIKSIIEKEGYSILEKEYENDNFVFDISRGSVSSGTHEESSASLRKVIKKHSTITIGLLPNKNRKKSLEFLFKRECKRDHFKGWDKIELMDKVIEGYDKFSKLPKNFLDKIIYTEGKSPEEIVNEIIESLKR
jgi:shikimate kinase